ncbi:MAG: ABC-2 family transporter protein [Defluviitaleaceae bacterium]|nr:ABC-2 family transporter protein [Defluviitaleaceae bacterium]
MLKEFRVYRQFVRINLLSGLEYKGWWLMIFQVLVATVGDPLAVILVFSRFGNIGAWSMERILLMYAMAFTAYGLGETLFRGFSYFPYRMIRSGDFDRVLLRPKSLFVQVSASFFHIHRAARPFMGLCIIIWSLVRLDVQFTFVNVMVLIFALAGGFLTYAGVFVLSSGVAFFTINALDWIHVLTSASREVVRVPTPYLPQALRHIFIFVMPVLVIIYFPAAAIGDWGGAYWRGWLALPAGAAFFAAGMLFWRIGVSHYKSTGS